MLCVAGVDWLVVVGRVVAWLLRGDERADVCVFHLVASGARADYQASFLAHCRGKGEFLELGVWGAGGGDVLCAVPGAQG